MYIFFFELARFIGINKFFEIYFNISGNFYAGVMSHDPPQIQIPQKWTLKQGNDTKSVCFLAYIVSAVQKRLLMDSIIFFFLNVHKFVV